MIIYYEDINAVNERQLAGFFVGWRKPPTVQQHYQLLCGSTFFIVAVDDKTDKVVGFVTALSDGVFSAFIPLLEVLPTYQSKGIGTKLMKKMLEKLQNIANVDLTCDTEMQSFYARFGMLPSNGMVLRK